MAIYRKLPPPFGDPIAIQPRYKDDAQAGLMSQRWKDYYIAIGSQLDSMPAKAASLSLLTSFVSVSATDFTNGGVNGGEYRLSWWYGVVIPNGINSALEVTFTYQYRGVSKSIVGANLVTDSTSEFDTDVKFIPIDGNTPVTYTVAYSTGFGSPMQYDLFACLEQVPM